MSAVGKLAVFAAGATGAVLARRVYLASVAFPTAVREMGEKMTADIRTVREFGDQLDAQKLSQKEKQAAMSAYIAGRMSQLR